MSEPVSHRVKVRAKDGRMIELPLKQFETGGMPVLLLHGASANSKTFTIPEPAPDGTPRCLVDYLRGEGFEPWLLDWRGSGDWVDTNRDRLQELRDLLDFDHAAEQDIPLALEKIVSVRDDAQAIGAIGHCLGAGTLAQAIAGGHVTAKRHRLTHVVLQTLGLFYEPPLDSRLKTQDRVLERLRLGPAPVPTIDPQHTPWPEELERLYQLWAQALRTHHDAESETVQELCNRLSFMYGAPYLESNLVPEIHHDTTIVGFAGGRSAPLVGDEVESDSASGTLHELIPDGGSWKEGTASGWLILFEAPRDFVRGEALKVGDVLIARATSAERRPAELQKQFGPIPLRMYAQGAQNARRRVAAKFGAENDDLELLSDESLRYFDDLEAVTLITGAKNQLWHRASIDRMHEWLLRSRHRHPDTRRKWVLSRYGHQDLLWGKLSHVDVFPRIRLGLPDDPRAPSRTWRRRTAVEREADTTTREQRF